MWRAARFLSISCFLLSAFCHVSSAQTIELRNASTNAGLGPRGLISVADIASGSSIDLAADEWSITLNGHTLRSEDAKPSLRKTAENEAVYEYDLSPYRIHVTYSIRPGWAFVSKQLRVVTCACSDLHRRQGSALGTEIANSGAVRLCPFCLCAAIRLQSRAEPEIAPRQGLWRVPSP